MQDIELTQQDQDFSFQPMPRLEAVARHADEKEGNCNHATIMFSFATDREFKWTEFSETRGRSKTVKLLNPIYDDGYDVYDKLEVMLAKIQVVRQFVLEPHKQHS